MKTSITDTLSNTTHPASRRSFIQHGLAGLAATAALPGLVPTVFAAPASNARKKIRIGVAGGNFGTMFYWHEHPECIVAAVTDLLPERRELLRQTYKCAKSYPSLEEMVKDPNLDAIAVFTDAPKHYAHATLVLSHGKHVISAVPAVMGHSVAEGLDQAHQLYEKVTRSGLTYMMAETSYWQHKTITARKWYNEGALGQIICCESDYFHPGVDLLNGAAKKLGWRFGLPPMFYPTHCTAHLLGITRERLVEVTCNGWVNDDPVRRDIFKQNPFSDNQFWNETAHFRTNTGKPFRARVWWEGPVWGGEMASWFGSKMTLTAAGEVWRRTDTQEKDDAGFARQAIQRSRLEEKEWWATDLLPEPLRHASGHDGSHTFITHEFIDALVSNRRPAVNINEALAYTVPGIIAHQSALKDGESLKIPQLD